MGVGMQLSSGPRLEVCYNRISCVCGTINSVSKVEMHFISTRKCWHDRKGISGADITGMDTEYQVSVSSATEYGDKLCNDSLDAGCH